MGLSVVAVILRHWCSF